MSANNEKASQQSGKNSPARSPPNESISDCAAAVEVDRKVEKLGEVINHVESRVHKLETQLDRRVDALDARLAPYEDYKPRIDESTRQLLEVQERLKKQQLNVDTSLEQKVSKQAGTIRSMEVRMKQLEQLAESRTDQETEALELRLNQQQATLDVMQTRIAQLTSDTASQEVNIGEVALELLCRLQQGGTLSLAVTKQLQSALKDASFNKIGVGQAAEPRKPPPKKRTQAQAALEEAVDDQPHKFRAGRRHALTHDDRKAVIDAALEAGDDSAAVLSPRSVRSRYETPPERRPVAKNHRTPLAKNHEAEVPETQQEDGIVVAQPGDEDEDELPYIPGERRSGRTPMPRRFPDQVPWGQVNKMVYGQDPES